ncbi:hypothetical protein AKJ16_DCAP06296 [Drosera capensis]
MDMNFVEAAAQENVHFPTYTLGYETEKVASFFLAGHHVQEDRGDELGEIIAGIIRKGWRV